ncbi:MAG: hypothetical protein R6T91_04340 [Bacteroidales bacterium]
MQKVVLKIQKLKIHRMPGLPNGLIALDNLAPNINVIFGENTSGKSSTARMIQKIIWPENTKRHRAESTVLLNDTSHNIYIESEQTGGNENIAGIPASENKQYYMLALHELLFEKESNLAKTIMNQAIGGFDLNKAAQQLNYDFKTSKKNISEYKTYQDSSRNLKKTISDHNNLKKEQNQLADLKNQKLKAEDAKRKLEFFRSLKEFIEAANELQKTENRKQEFPEVLEKLDGTEYEKLTEYENEIEEKEQKLTKAKSLISQAKNEQNNLNVNQDKLNDQIINELSDLSNKLHNIENELQKLKEEKIKHQRKATEFLKTLNEDINPEEWKAIDLNNIRKLESFIRKANQVLAKEQTLKEQLELLKTEIKTKPQQLIPEQQLNAAIETLSKWLKDENKSKTKDPARILLTISGITTALLTLFFDWWGLTGLALIILSLLYKPKPKHHKLNTRVSDFKDTGFNPPENWTSEKVTERLNELIIDLQLSKQQAFNNQKKDQLQQKLEDTNKQIEKLNAQRLEFIKELKAVPSWPDFNNQEFNSLYFFIDNLQKWMDTNNETTALSGQLESKQQQYDQTLKKANDILMDAGISKAENSLQLKASKEHLNKQWNIIQRTLQTIREQKGIIDESQNRIAQLQDKRDRIFEKTKVETKEKHLVQRLTNQIKSFRDIEKEIYSQNQAYQKIKTQLEQHPKYDDYKTSLEEFSMDQIEESIHELQSQQQKLDDIKEKITRIETNITAKLEGHELEEAINQKDKALANLEKKYQEDLQSVTGAILTKHIRQETDKNNRPEVYKRAGELLNKFSNGRYKLQLGENDQPEFQAYDTVDNQSRKLQELSSGTRVQLVLAVRLAFVESQETQVQLPVLADELLANSDDIRAQSIIKALIDISKEGRQIFYFTAQQDEVSKWKYFLEQEKEVSYKTYQLDQELSTTDQPLPDFFTSEEFQLSTDTIPEPHQLSHSEYRNKLNVPPFQITSDSVNHLHLWYLIEDPKLLHQCLSSGIRYWGALKHFIQNNGHIAGLTTDRFEHLSEKAQIFHNFQTLYMKGRPKPIRREVLEQNDSGIKGKFVDDIAKVAAELHWNPEALILALENKAVKGFASSKLQKLKSFLYENGYLDYQQPLSMDELLIQIKAFVSQSSVSFDEADNLIKRILNSNEQNQTLF